MRSLLLLCVVLAIGAADDNIKIPKDEKEAARKYAKECVDQLGISQKTIDEAKKGHLPNDAKLGDFAFCFLRKSGVVNDEGQLNEKATLSKLPKEIDKDEAKKILDACKNASGNSPQQKTLDMLKCIKKKTNFDFSF